MYGNPDWAGSWLWHGQGVGVQGVMGSNLRRPPILEVSVSNEPPVGYKHHVQVG